MNTARKGITRLVLLVAVGGVLGCETWILDPPPETDDPGPLFIQVNRAGVGTGAITIVVSGGAIERGALSPGFTGKVVSISATEVRMLVRGSIGLGMVGTIQVPDRRVSYSVRLLEAAANRAGGYQVLEHSQFDLTLVRPDPTNPPRSASARPQDG